MHVCTLCFCVMEAVARMPLASSCFHWNNYAFLVLFLLNKHRHPSFSGRKGRTAGTASFHLCAAIFKSEALLLLSAHIGMTKEYVCVSCSSPARPSITWLTRARVAGADVLRCPWRRRRRLDVKTPYSASTAITHPIHLCNHNNNNNESNRM